MIKDYFFLSRLAYELNEQFNGSIILESFTSQKDRLFIRLLQQKEFLLELCVNHSLPYILIKDATGRKKRNSLDIFSQILNLKLSSVFIAKNDRVILFQIENNISLFFAIRGKFTNIYLLSNNNFISFKKIEDDDLEKIKTEFQNLEFVPPLSLPEFDNEDFNIEIESYKNRYPYISKEFLESISIKDNITIQNIIDQINRIFYADIVLFYDIDKKTVKLGVTPTVPNTNTNVVGIFSKANESIFSFLSELKSNEEFNNLFHNVQKFTDKELKYLNNKFNSISTRIQNGSKEEYYRKIAELLLINKSELKTGLSEIVLSDIYSGNQLLKIELHKKLSPQKNIEHYFNKAKEEKLFFERSKNIISDIESKLKLFNDARIELEEIKSLQQLNSLARKIGIKMKNITEKKEPKLKFKQYVIDSKFNIYVGKDSKSNDLLTMKFAKQNDYWFHARSVSGSHVVLRVDNKNDVIPKNILKKTASIAAFFSKAKHSFLVPVSYTLKKYVVKKKGMDIGQVALMKEQTLLVKPEIPSDAILIEQSET